MLAYRIQAAAFGYLDRAILRRLRETKGEALESGQARAFATRGPTTREGVGLKSGALVVREWNGRIERVMVLDEGYAWNGGVYRTLSQAARAITSHAKQLIWPFTTVERPMQEGLAFRSKGSIGVVVRRGAKRE